MHSRKEDAASAAVLAKQGDILQNPTKKVSPMPSMMVQGSSASNIDLLSPTLNTCRGTLRKPVPPSHQKSNTLSQLASLPNNPMLDSANANLSVTSSASVQSASAIPAFQQPSSTAHSPQAPAAQNILQRQVGEASPEVRPKPKKSLSSLFCQSPKNNNLSPTIGNPEDSFLVHHPEPIPRLGGHPSSLRTGGGRNCVQRGSSLGSHAHPCGQTQRPSAGQRPNCGSARIQAHLGPAPATSTSGKQTQGKDDLHPGPSQSNAKTNSKNKPQLNPKPAGPKAKPVTSKGKPKKQIPVVSLPSHPVPLDKAVQPSKSVNNNTKLAASASIAPKTNLKAAYTQAERYQFAPNVRLQAHGEFQPQFSFSYNRGDSAKSRAITHSHPGVVHHDGHSSSSNSHHVSSSHHGASYFASHSGTSSAQFATYPESGRAPGGHSGGQQQSGSHAGTRSYGKQSSSSPTDGKSKWQMSSGLRGNHNEKESHSGSGKSSLSSSPSSSSSVSGAGSSNAGQEKATSSSGKRNNSPLKEQQQSERGNNTTTNHSSSQAFFQQSQTSAHTQYISTTTSNNLHESETATKPASGAPPDDEDQYQPQN